jgi:hypothetical protein
MLVLLHHLPRHLAQLVVQVAQVDALLLRRRVAAHLL